MPSRRVLQPGWLAHYLELISAWAPRSASPADAEDMVQDVATGLLQREHAAIVDPKAYLYGASIRRYKGALRQRQRASMVSLDDLSEQDQLIDPIDPEVMVRTAHLSDALRRALLELPLRCRQVFLWNKVEGYTQAEIAQRLGLSQSMVEKDMKRALVHVHARLRHHAPR